MWEQEFNRGIRDFQAGFPMKESSDSYIGGYCWAMQQLTQ